MEQKERALVSPKTECSNLPVQASKLSCRNDNSIHNQQTSIYQVGGYVEVVNYGQF